MRDNSPPDATLASGRGATALCADTKNSTCSSPLAPPSASGLNATSKLPPDIATVCIAAVTFAASFVAAFARATLNRLAASR
jgi:hypothetical protein